MGGKKELYHHLSLATGYGGGEGKKGKRVRHVMGRRKRGKGKRVLLPGRARLPGKGREPPAILTVGKKKDATYFFWGKVWGGGERGNVSPDQEEKEEGFCLLERKAPSRGRIKSQTEYLRP